MTPLASVRPQWIVRIPMHLWSRKTIFPLVGALAFVCAARAIGPHVVKGFSVPAVG